MTGSCATLKILYSFEADEFENTFFNGSSAVVGIFVAETYFNKPLPSSGHLLNQHPGC
jgi:hypothetical protein